MVSTETSSAASRLCSVCGLCCNGVMFHTVRLQPRDSAKDLSALGLKLKRKKGANYILQPCPAFRGSHCSIYAARPERCRLFECKQLQRVSAGEITEAMALERIQDVQRRVAEVTALLEKTGGTNPKRPLSKRCEKAMAEPLHADSDPAAVELRNQLTLAMNELDAMLDREFRVHRDNVVPAVANDAQMT
jgi:Fe-S-cluster containining protein